MIAYHTNIEDFWSTDLKNFKFVNSYSAKQTDQTHDNYGNLTNNLLQAFNEELPESYNQFYSKLKINEGSMSMICLAPGQVIPIHTDKFYKLREKTNADISQCLRYLIFLEDWTFGHIAEFQECCITKWNKGDVWVFDYKSPHWAANASSTNFITCQVNTVV